MATASPVIKSKVLHIRSEDGINFQTGPDQELVKTGFTINFDSPIECEANQSMYLSLASLAFPYSFFTTDRTNNELVVVVEYPWLVPPNQFRCWRYTDVAFTAGALIKGNYDAYTFRDEILEKLNALNANGGFADFNNTAGTNKFLMLYKENTNSYYFGFEWGNTTVTPALAETPNVYFLWTDEIDGNTPPADGCFRQLGMTGTDNFFFSVPQAILPATPTFPAQYASTDSVVDMTGGRMNNLYVRTNLTTNSAIESRNKSVSNVLQKCPINSPPNSFIYFYASQSKSRLLLNQKTISSVNISLTDDEGTLIDNNNVEWTLSLLFETEWTGATLATKNNSRRLTDKFRKTEWKGVGETHVSKIRGRT